MTYSPRLSFALRFLRSRCSFSLISSLARISASMRLRLRLSESRRSSFATFILINAIKAAKAMMNMPNFQIMESAASKSSFMNTPSEKIMWLQGQEGPQMSIIDVSLLFLWRCTSR